MFSPTISFLSKSIRLDTGTHMSGFGGVRKVGFVLRTCPKTLSSVGGLYINLSACVFYFRRNYYLVQSGTCVFDLSVLSSKKSHLTSSIRLLYTSKSLLNFL